MTSLSHGLSVGISRFRDEFFLTLKVVGKLTHDDYLTITPMLENALVSVEKPHVKAFVDCSQLEGWELRAAWDDCKLGISQGQYFSKIAVYSHKTWLEYATKVANWFMGARVRYFDNENDALIWLSES